MRLAYFAVPTIHANGTIVPSTPRPPSPISRLGISLSPERNINYKQNLLSKLSPERTLPSFQQDKVIRTYPKKTRSELSYVKDNKFNCKQNLLSMDMHRLSPERTISSFQRDKVTRTYNKKTKSSIKDRCGVKDHQPISSPGIVDCPVLTSFPKEPDETFLQDSCCVKDHHLVPSSEILCPVMTSCLKEPEDTTSQDSCGQMDQKEASSHETVVCPGITSIVKDPEDITSQDSCEVKDNEAMSSPEIVVCPGITSVVKEPEDITSQ
ncbi:hypothetical protein L9F63_021023, partial [Diploptera punctata]